MLSLSLTGFRYPLVFNPFATWLGAEKQIPCFRFPPTCLPPTAVPVLGLPWDARISLSPSLCCLLLVSLCCSWNGIILLAYQLSPIFPTSHLCLCAVATLVSGSFSDCLFFFSLCFPSIVSWRAQVRRLIFPSSVWGQPWYNLKSNVLGTNAQQYGVLV